MSRLQPRLRRLETATPSVPTHEESLFACDRLTDPPAGYTEQHRRRDQGVVSRWTRAVIAAGLALGEDQTKAGAMSDYQDNLTPIG
jgi:hypothetical protein